MSSKQLFLTAAMAGAFAGAAGFSSAARACGNDPPRAVNVHKMGCPGKDKSGCSGKDKTKKDKASCQGKDKAGKGSGDKAACSGKHGCGGKM
jgi:hypothetical protein